MYRNNRYNNNSTRLKLWDKDFKKAYPHIMSDTVIAYANKVRERQCLPNFQPLLYLKDENYRKLMDEHATKLLEALNKVCNAIVFEDIIASIIAYGRLQYEIFGVDEITIFDDDEDELIIIRKPRKSQSQELEQDITI